MRLLVVAALVLAPAAARAEPPPDPALRPDPAASPDPAWPRGTAAWAAAELDPGLRSAGVRWEAAAGAFDALPGADAALYAALAWSRAIRGTSHAIAISAGDPTEALDEHERHALDAVARFFDLAGATAADPRAVAARFTRASILWRRGHLEDALPDLEDLIAHHPGASVAPYSAEILLDSLNRLGREDDVQRWVEIMLASPALVRGDKDVAEELVRVQLALVAHAATRAERAGDFATCGDLYAKMYALSPSASDGDELLYNAALCAGRAGAPAVALARYQHLLRAYPASALAARTLERMASEHAAIGDFAAAARDYERQAERTAVTDAREASRALERAVPLRAALGDPAADSDVELAARLDARDPVRLSTLDLELARTRLGAGDRRGARRAVTRAIGRAASGWELVGSMPDDQLAPLLWDVACDDALVDGACLTHDVPATRDHVLTALALGRARRSSASPRNALVLAGELLEAALARRDPARDREAAAALVALTHSRDEDVAATARAALARLARHAGEPAEPPLHDVAPSPRAGPIAPAPEP